jgi:hypothetical protein
MLRGVEGVVYDDCTDRWVPHPLRMLCVSIVLRDVLPVLRVTNWRIAGPYFFYQADAVFMLRRWSAADDGDGDFHPRWCGQLGIHRPYCVLVSALPTGPPCMEFQAAVGGVCACTLGYQPHMRRGVSCVCDVVTLHRFGFVGVGLPLTVVEASVSGLFVAFAEAPATISYCHPLIYHRCVLHVHVSLWRRLWEWGQCGQRWSRSRLSVDMLAVAYLRQVCEDFGAATVSTGAWGHHGRGLMHMCILFSLCFSPTCDVFLCA